MYNRPLFLNAGSDEVILTGASAHEEVLDVTGDPLCTVYPPSLANNCGIVRMPAAQNKNKNARRPQRTPAMQHLVPIGIYLEFN